MEPLEPVPDAPRVTEPPSGLHLGFLCNWDPVPERTWSGSAWQLYRALGARTTTTDIGMHLPVPARRALQLVNMRRRNGEWVSRWEHAQLFERYLARSGAHRAHKHGCDAVVEIQDVASIDVPFFLYQDLSYDALAEEFADQRNGARVFFRSLDTATFERRRARQREIYARASGVFAMSAWLARSLVEVSGLPPEKVHVVPPGATSLAAGDASPPEPPVRPAPRRRLLFVGTTFLAKGADVVLEALAHLRRHDPEITLTVAGPSVWPAEGDPPPGVRFVGRVPRADLISLYDAHDLLVMPSRIEGFGIVFVEALGRALPCVGRRAFAMTELITPGRNGALAESDDPEALAALILATLADDRIYETTRAEYADVVRKYTWDATARTMLDVVRRTVS